MGNCTNSDCQDGVVICSTCRGSDYFGYDDDGNFGEMPCPGCGGHYEETCPVCDGAGTLDDDDDDDDDD